MIQMLLQSLLPMSFSWEAQSAQCDVECALSPRPTPVVKAATSTPRTYLKDGVVYYASAVTNRANTRVSHKMHSCGGLENTRNSKYSSPLCFSCICHHRSMIRPQLLDVGLSAMLACKQLQRVRMLQCQPRAEWKPFVCTHAMRTPAAKVELKTLVSGFLRPV